MNEVMELDEAKQENQAMAAPPPSAKPASREEKYVERLGAFLEEANEGGAMSDFVGALAWTLARIAGHYGKPYVAGDIVRRFGSFLCNIEEQKAARIEAEEARKAGLKPH